MNFNSKEIEVIKESINGIRVELTRIGCTCVGDVKCPACKAYSESAKLYNMITLRKF